MNVSRTILALCTLAGCTPAQLVTDGDSAPSSAALGADPLPGCNSAYGTACWQPYADAVDACQARYAGAWSAINCCTAAANHALKQCAARQLGCQYPFDDANPADYRCNADWSVRVCRDFNGSVCLQPYSDRGNACAAEYLDDGSPALNCCSAGANHWLKQCADTQMGCFYEFDDTHPVTDYACNADWTVNEATAHHRSAGASCPLSIVAGSGFTYLDTYYVAHGGTFTTSVDANVAGSAYWVGTRDNVSDCGAGVYSGSATSSQVIDLPADVTGTFRRSLEIRDGAGAVLCRSNALIIVVY